MGRGFDGTVWSRDEFVAHVNSITLPTWIKAVTLHSMWAPNIEIQRDTTKSPDPKVDASQRMKNAWGEVSGRLGGRGWHLTCFEGGWIGKGCDITQKGIHAHSWNSDSIGVEMAANFDTEGRLAGGKIIKSDDPYSGPGLQILDTAAFVFAQILRRRGLPADKNTIRFHRHEATAIRGGKKCPGRRVDEADFIKRVQAYLGNVDNRKTPEPLPKQQLDVRTIQERLKHHGYDPGPIDGIAGPKTVAAIKAMQTFLRISPSGLVGPWMMEQLKKDKPTPVPVQPEPAPTPVPPVDVKPEPIVAPKQPEPNPARAMRILQATPWPKHWAAGAVAQAQRESYPDLRPWAQGDWHLNGKFVPNTKENRDRGAKPTAFTIWQLREDRYDNYLSFAAARGKPWDDFETQVLWCPHELKTSEKLAWRWLVRAETVEQACAAMVWYERPKGYISSKAKAATSWQDVFAVSEACDGYSVRLDFARKLMK